MDVHLPPIRGPRQMEEQDYASRSAGSDEFALVALRDAAMAIASPGRPYHGHEGDMTSPYGSLSHSAAGPEDRFDTLETSPSLQGFSTSGLDEYTSDPRFLESQKELRNLLLTSAQSLAPTRATSPVGQEGSTSELSEQVINQSAISNIVSTGERVLWLRNYLEEVAPWVFRHPLHDIQGLPEAARYVRQATTLQNQSPSPGTVLGPSCVCYAGYFRSTDGAGKEVKRKPG